MVIHGLKDNFSVDVLGWRSEKVEVQYLHDYAGLTSSFAKRIVNFSGVLGTQAIFVGADVSFNSATWSFDKYNIGVNIGNASLTMNDKGDYFSLSYYRLVNSLPNTAAGAELSYNLFSDEELLAFGAQHIVNPHMTVKAHVNTSGKIGALIYSDLRSKAFITVSAEYNILPIEKYMFGLAVELKP